MIIFHEGMPRSGKSYAAFKDHIIAALAAGRRVYCRIDGLNYKQIADLANIDEDECRGLLIELTEEQCQNLTAQEFQNDALIVIDEAQNYWPAGRGNLSPEMLKWIAEHGHHGHDVLLMGQLLKDVHRSWLNRTNRKIQFIKKDVVGKSDEYKWIMYHGRPDGEGRVKFSEVQKGDEKYDDRYFGCYKSHSEGTENKGNYVDDRVNIWKSPLFRKWLPLLGVLALLSIGYLVYLFKGDGLTPKAPPSKSPVSAPAGKVSQPIPAIERPAAAPSPAAPSLAAPVKVADKGAEWDFADLVTHLTTENRPRLAGVIRSAKATRIVVEWRDSSLRMIESMTNEQLRALGWHVLVTDDDSTAFMIRPGHRLVATAWPIREPLAKVTQGQKEAIASHGQPVRMAAIESASE